MKYLRLFDDKQDYSNEIGDKIEVDFPNVSLVSGGNKSVFYNADVKREAYFFVTEPAGPASLEREIEVTPEMGLINDYRMFSEIYLNDSTENLLPKLVEGSFTIDANDVVKVDETTLQIKNPKKYNSTYVSSFIVSCDEEILDDYFIGFYGLVGPPRYGEDSLLNDNTTGGTRQRDITLMGTLNELFDTPTLKEIARIDSNTIDLTDFFINEFGLVSSLNVVVFKPGENDELIPLTTTNSYVANIIEEKTYDVSETPVLEDFLLLDFTLKCEEDILPTDILFTYGNGPVEESIGVETIETASSDGNDGIVLMGTIEDFLAYANDEGLGIGLIDSKTLGPVNGYLPRFNYIMLCGIMRDGVVLTQKVNIVGVNSSEYGNYSLSTDKLGENKIRFKIPNRFKTPSFYRSYLIGLNNKALKYNKVITPYAFADCPYLESITIPNTVTTIGDRAFYSCENLTNVTIPDSVTTIGEYAFNWCESLTSIVIPDSVTTIGDRAFYYCQNLTDVTIGNGVTSFGEDILYGCDSLTAFYGEYASEDNRCLIVDGVLKYFAPTGLTEYTIPDGVTTIGDRAFYNCQNLKSITIPDSVTSIGNNAFQNCYNLTNVTIPDSVTTIGDNAFYYCRNLKNVDIPDSVTSIGERAFYNCTNLTSVVIGNGVTTIETNAFYGCYNITNVTMGNNVTSIGDNAFYGCNYLTSVYITDIAAWCNISFGNDYANPLCKARNLYLNNELVTDLIIPDSVTSIGNYAFRNCDSLTSVTIPDSVTSIGNYTFYDCDNLTSITIPDGVTTIGESAFYSCDGIRSISIPDSVTSIGQNAFYYCTSLSSVYCKASTPPSLGGTSVFYSDLNIYVPEGSLQAYKTAAYWSNYANFIVEYDYNSTTTISYTTSDGMPANANGLIISNNYQNGAGELTYIGKDIIPASIFRNCDNLTSVTIGNSVTSFGYQAFRYCENLTNVTIGDGITSIEDNVFDNCSTLGTITCLATTAPSLGSNVFYSTPKNGILRVPTGSDYSTWLSRLSSGWIIEYIE